MILKAAIAVLHNDVLNDSLTLIYRQEVIDELDDIFRTTQHSHDLVLARGNFTSFLRSLHSDCDPTILIKCLKHEA